MTKLVITADDYGYFPSYDRGILEAAGAGAVDAVSAFSTREGIEPLPLLETGVEVGLHLDLGVPGNAARADDAERRRVATEIRRQLEAFERHYERPPAYLDGHHHCHAREGLGAVVADIAVEAGLPVRSANVRQRRILRCRGVATQDLLIGRSSEQQPPLPEELEGSVAGLPGTVIWMVHPGYAGGARQSSFDAGREDDLRLLLEWEPPAGTERCTLRSALALPA